MNRNETLDLSKALINGQRQEDYGAAELNFQRIADRWNQFLGDSNVNIKPWQVAVMMADLKIARMCQEGPYKSIHEDTPVDAIGYLALAVELSDL